ncbi:MAG: FimV/HubP family polar landmark protein [Pseudomonadota bacterium]
MFGKSVIATSLLLLAVSTRIFALGLGEIDVRSALNEPFNAVVSLTSGTDEQLQTLKVSIASREAFSRAGIARPVILSEFKFSVERTDTGAPVIRISTKDPIREPFLDFLLEAAWPNGRLLRQYTVLIDPPLTMPVARPPPVAAPVTPSPSPKRATAPVRQPAPATAAVPAATPSSDSYGPIRRNETLWTIAKRVRPGSDISVEQMMLALQRTNPGAFINNNINNLRRDAVLQVPQRDEILSMSVADANRETRQQHDEWQSKRAAPEPEPEPEVAAAPAAEPATEARLQLVAPEDDLATGDAVPGSPDSAADSGEGSSNLRQQLALANEEAEAGRAQSEELKTRVSKLEEQLASMQRLLELKDEQLASIQAGLAASAEAAAETDAAGDDEAVTDESAGNNEAADADSDSEAATAATEPDEPVAAGQPLGLVDRMMNNPVLTGLGVLVAMVLGGIFWNSTRQRKQTGLFSDEPTLESQLAEAAAEPKPAKQKVKVSDHTMLTDLAAPDAEDGISDPVKEADIFLAYGRVQQAENMVMDGLEKDPKNMDLKLKLLEVYHAAGNTEAFNIHAQNFRNLVTEDDSNWQSIAVMGYEMAPENPLYKAVGNDAVSGNGVDFDMDLSGMDNTRNEAVPAGEALDVDYAESDGGRNTLPDSLEFNLDELGDDEEDASEGLLDSTHEVSTKLDLARAYIDMGDPDGARSILEEVLNEGNDEQKSEAELLFAKLA